jgi:hypothetical protein
MVPKWSFFSSISDISHASIPLLTILRQCTGFIAQEIFYATELLWQCACADDRIGDFWVILDLVSVYSLAHVEIHTKAVVSVAI